MIFLPLKANTIERDDNNVTVTTIIVQKELGLMFTIITKV